MKNAQTAVVAGQHTPGPWKARSYRSDGKAGNAQNGSIWIDCDAWTKSGRAVAGTVAEVYARGTGTNDPSVQDANARLIAAAPDAYAVCQAFLAEISGVCGANNREAAFLEKIEDMARAVIAKVDVCHEQAS